MRRADFFRPGRTYTRTRRSTEEFRVEHVATNPGLGHGHLVAFGWWKGYAEGWAWAPFDTDSTDGWTEITACAESTQPASFFQPGHVYTTTRHRFRCDHITRHPGVGDPRALGWITRTDGGWWEPADMAPVDWDHGDWTEVEAGDAP